MARFLMLVATLALLGGCERSFDDRYDDAQRELNAKAAAIKMDADKQIEAREAADAALAEKDLP